MKEYSELFKELEKLKDSPLRNDDASANLLILLDAAGTVEKNLSDSLIYMSRLAEKKLDIEQEIDELQKYILQVDVLINIAKDVIKSFNLPDISDLIFEYSQISLSNSHEKDS
jgi:hypothetical protein